MPFLRYTVYLSSVGNYGNKRAYHRPFSFVLFLFFYQFSYNMQCCFYLNPPQEAIVFVYVLQEGLGGGDKKAGQ
ncbi:hypothetical protein CKG00_04560 [Morganella morganii]|uniref:Uncharacterized protein n=1 Tax=Morganella morganii TaxID=582 RepID=A0A433ZUG7_MORMO|nr:hypothetical protein CKG00_04560 [Morganella morganii]